MGNTLVSVDISVRPYVMVLFFLYAVLRRKRNEKNRSFLHKFGKATCLYKSYQMYRIQRGKK